MDVKDANWCIKTMLFISAWLRSVFFQNRPWKRVKLKPARIIHNNYTTLEISALHQCSILSTILCAQFHRAIYIRNYARSEFKALTTVSGTSSILVGFSKGLQDPFTLPLIRMSELLLKTTVAAKCAVAFLDCKNLWWFSSTFWNFCPFFSNQGRW